MSFSADAPIQTENEDYLGRKHFSRAFARALRNLNPEESFVVGLFGEWGSGKTSVKNLALRALETRSKQPPLVIHFNPWLVSRQDQLVEAFFRDITAVMLKPFPGESSDLAQKRLSTFASYMSVLGTATEHGLELLAASGVPVAGLAAKAVQGVKKVAGALKDSAEAQKQITEDDAKTLAEVKQQLRQQLAARKAPVLVVIDDVDRLTRPEICLLFQLIKINADFPRFVYLVLCDRSFVTDALEELAPSRGAEFLEKIVQIAFDLPQPQWSDLVKIARADWDAICRASRDALKRSDSKRWNELLELARPYLRNVRTVRRWMNAVRFSFGFFQSKGGFDANPEDLLAVELLRVNEPALYERISKAKHELTYDQWEFASWLDQDGSKRRARKEALLATVDTTRRESAAAILDWAFPNAEWSVSKRADGSLLRDIRVGDRRCFDRYFQFVPGRETLSRHEVRHAIAACRQGETLERLFRNAQASGRLRLVLDHLLAHDLDVHPAGATIVESLFNIGDELPGGEWTFGGTGDQAYAVGFLISFLRSLPDQRERTRILFGSMCRSKGIVLPFLLAAYESNERHRQNDIESRLIVPQSHLKELEELAAEKLEQFQDSPLLTEAESVGMVLAIWMQWRGSPQNPGAWLRQNLRTPNGIWRALRSAAGYETSSDGRHYTGVSAKWLAKLIPIEDVDKAVEQIQSTPLSTDESRLLELYRVSRREMAEGT